ncbi:MAG: hypothetical protein KDA28_13530, partial [Phycisphaerales bacterium]|nr:hypothetical protein [Phycisphaerales bacterium]
LPPIASELDSPRVLERVASIRADVLDKARRFATSCADVRATLEKMVGAPASRINSLIRRIDRVRTGLGAFEPAHELAHRLKQTGILNRFKPDRAIELSDLTPAERQRAQIERDIENTRWLGDAASELGDMLEGRTRDTTVEVRQTRRVGAVVMAHPSLGALGTKRDLHHPFLAGRGLLALTIERLKRSGADVVIVATPEPDLLDLEGVELMRADVTPDPRIGAARRWASATWRGGLGGATIYDEAFLPEVCVEACKRFHLDACIPVNADWALVDPKIVQDVIDRYLADPEGSRVAFAQAPAGLGVCLLDQRIVHDLASRKQEIGWLATIGAMLGYVPIAPQADPITRENCVRADAVLRNVRTRFVADTTSSMQHLRQALSPLEHEVLDADATTIAALVGDQPPLPQDVCLEICTGRMTSGLMGALRLRGSDSVERSPMSDSLAHRILSQAGRLGLPVTFHGVGDPCMHSGLADFILMARDLGVPGVHVRTDLLAPIEDLDEILDAKPDVISVDIGGARPETVRTMLGVDHLDRVTTAIDHLIEQDVCWVVPRLTRCDETMPDIEGFYDHWMMRTGACVIDALPIALPEARIARLPIPGGAPRDSLVVLADGICPRHERDVRGDHPIGDLSCETIEQVWRRVARDERVAVSA